MNVHRLKPQAINLRLLLGTVHSQLMSAPEQQQREWREKWKAGGNKGSNNSNQSEANPVCVCVCLCRNNYNKSGQGCGVSKGVGGLLCVCGVTFHTINLQ